MYLKSSKPIANSFADSARDVAIKVVPGIPSSLTSVCQTSANSIVSGGKIRVSIQPFDKYGNRITPSSSSADLLPSKFSASYTYTLLFVSVNFNMNSMAIDSTNNLYYQDLDILKLGSYKFSCYYNGVSLQGSPALDSKSADPVYTKSTLKIFDQFSNSYVAFANQIPQANYPSF